MLESLCHILLKFSNTFGLEMSVFQRIGVMEAYIHIIIFTHCHLQAIFYIISDLLKLFFSRTGFKTPGL